MRSESPKAILRDLESLRQFGSVLYIAAHPDDENTELLAYLARGRNYRTAYLSLTRGDGGQNVLSPDLGAKLGVARTQELLAARQVDGARQFFSRAVDYGFSKNYLETLNVWDKDEVLSDMVRVIRTFRPDIVITRFSPKPGGTHGHHTTSAVLAIEAFKMAGDPKAFPEQHLAPWHPKRLLWNTSIWQKDKILNEPILKIETTGKDSVTGQTFFDVAAASRGMHKTQGFDQFKMPGNSGDQRFEQFQLLGGEPATIDIMDGVDTTWARTAGGAAVQAALDAIVKDFNTASPEASVPALLKLRKQMEELPEKNAVLVEKRQLLDRIILECLGLSVVTTTPNANVLPGETLPLHIAVSMEAKGVPVKWVSVDVPASSAHIERNTSVASGSVETFDTTQPLPKTTPLTQPYWLQKPGTPGMFHVDDPKLIGTPENAPPFPINTSFDIGGQTIVAHGEAVQISTDALGNERQHRVNVIAPISLHPVNDIAIMNPGESRSIEIEIKSARKNVAGSLELEKPRDWLVEPTQQKFDLHDAGQTARFSFKLTAPKHSDSATITASAAVDGVHYSNEYQEVAYAHLPTQVLQPPAVVKAVSVDLQKRGQTVGYLPGAGDSIPENLQQIGYAVKMLDDANLSDADLQDVDAVVIGVRAFNVRANIDKAMPVLFKYVENGGTVIVQYNRPDKLKSEKLAPYPISISADRVTDEKAQMTFLAPEHPVLNTPNKLTSADFDGWVQERGLYFPNKWDEHFTPIFECKDAGEPPTKGALLIARYGKGYYVYTGLSLFRELPAAVPGAYRLFANMVSLGK